MTDLVFYTMPISRGQIARWMLEEVGEPYETVILDGESMKSPDYLAINPMGKVPAIRHKGIVVTETAAICAYLADAFPDAGLAPPPQDPRRGTPITAGCSSRPDPSKTRSSPRRSACSPRRNARRWRATARSKI